MELKIVFFFTLKEQKYILVNIKQKNEVYLFISSKCFYFGIYVHVETREL